ncbi:MAG TPA: sigma-54 dependent transcriptional regulator [Bryobacterales bacterium]|jgi:DNA-binding NtrC family response regulator|nr:sigma-54 dependent transcriptional regulator [Bryobacterales bacterium]
MPETKGKILIVDDDTAIRESLETFLAFEGYQVDLAVDGTSGLLALESKAYDLVLLDLMMPDRSGLDVLKELRQRDVETPVMVITAYGSVENAVAAIKLGANDFITKPWNNEKLLIEIDQTISKRRLERENTQLKRALKQRYNFSNIIGKSEAMRKVLDLVGQVAQSRSTVLLHGESGTGKELMAKAIHTNSPRAEKAFVAVNSGSLPSELLESTLFGHLKGSFTSAIQTKKGYFEIADEGTIFLDEISTISLEMQAKLLRVIQEKEFVPVGGVDPRKVDVRIVAATNVDLRKQVEEGRFREDLYYRLNVIQIDLPPLRERREDIPALVEHFFTKYCRENDKFLDPDGSSRLRFAPEAMRMLMDYHWPGNVRELENVVERAVVLATDTTVPVDLLPDTLLTINGVPIRRRIPTFTRPPEASLFDLVDEFERRIIIEQLEKYNWSQTDTAESFRIPLSTLNQKIKRLNIEIKRKRDLASAGKG